MVILLLALAAGAAEPVMAPNDEGVEEIVVHGDLLVEQARRQLIYDLQLQGYTDIADKGDYLLLRNQSPWKGEIRLYDDGWIQIKRQPVRVQSNELPWAERGSPLAWASCALYPPACLKVGGVLVSKRKLDSQKNRALGAVQQDAQVLGDRVADSATETRVNELPERLEALWVDGVPLQGEGHLATVAERKQALLAFWESRTDTEWGDRVREAVDAFLKAEVQTSEHAFTAAEIAAFNARRTCERELVLFAEGPS